MTTRYRLSRPAGDVFGYYVTPEDHENTVYLLVEGPFCDRSAMLVREGSFSTAHIPVANFPDNFTALEATMTTDTTAQIAELAAKVDALTTRVETAEAQQRQARTDLINFQNRTRGLILELVDDDELEFGAANNVLVALGLDPMTRTYRVTVTVHATQEVEIEVEANDEEDAAGKVRDGDFNAAIEAEVSSYDWAVDEALHETDTYNISEV